MTTPWVEGAGSAPAVDDGAVRHAAGSEAPACFCAAGPPGHSGAAGKDRTCDAWIFGPALYRAELQRHAWSGVRKSNPLPQLGRLVPDHSANPALIIPMTPGRGLMTWHGATRTGLRSGGCPRIRTANVYPEGPDLQSGAAHAIAARHPSSGAPCRIRTAPDHLERVVTSPEVQRCISSIHLPPVTSSVVAEPLRCWSTTEHQIRLAGKRHVYGAGDEDRTRDLNLG